MSNAYVSKHDPSVVIAGRNRLLAAVPNFLSNTEDFEVVGLVDYLVAGNYLSDLFYEEALESDE